MMYEWDETKRLINLEKHKLDFMDARLVFDGRPAIHAPSPKEGETRYISVALIGSKLYSVVWTWRGENRRIISFRRARHGEENAYQKIYG